jgi:hypothetical protein
VWALKKIGVLRDSAQNGLRTSAGIHASLYCVHTFTLTRCICQLMPENNGRVVATIRCTSNYFPVFMGFEVGDA